MFIEAFRFKKWADIRTLDAIRKIDKKTSPDIYDFVCQQINHMVIVEELFSCRLTRTPTGHEQTNTTIVPQLEVLRSRLLASDDWFNDYVSFLGKMDEAIEFTFVDGQQGQMTIEEILFHIVTHGSYHRGNIAHALDRASVPHPVDGYGVFIHEREPERRSISPEQ